MDCFYIFYNNYILHYWSMIRWLTFGNIISQLFNGMFNCSVSKVETRWEVTRQQIPRLGRWGGAGGRTVHLRAADLKRLIRNGSQPCRKLWSRLQSVLAAGWRETRNIVYFSKTMYFCLCLMMTLWITTSPSNSSPLPQPQPLFFSELKNLILAKLGFKRAIVGAIARWENLLNNFSKS